VYAVVRVQIGWLGYELASFENLASRDMALRFLCARTGMTRTGWEVP